MGNCAYQLGNNGRHTVRCTHERVARQPEGMVVYTHTHCSVDEGQESWECKTNKKTIESQIPCNLQGTVFEGTENDLPPKKPNFNRTVHHVKTKIRRLTNEIIERKSRYMRSDHINNIMWVDFRWMKEKPIQPLRLRAEMLEQHIRWLSNQFDLDRRIM